jgi:SAM-dependent methyltransferase
MWKNSVSRSKKQTAAKGPERTKEPQYQRQLELRDAFGLATLGLVTNQLWYNDPRHLCFLLSRYKFVAKMLSGNHRVLEVGCGDAFGTRLVQQEVGEICAVDFDPVFIKDGNKRMMSRGKFECKVHDFVAESLEDTFDAAYTIDVIEHIPKDAEDSFIANIVRCLAAHGVLIVGTPSVQSQGYASEFSKLGHVNCKDQTALKDLLLKFFSNVFVFSMNDEVVHTGFHPMAHYLIAVCTSKKLENGCCTERPQGKGM